jgi:hypothetical protein
MRIQHAFNLFVPFFIIMFRLVYKKYSNFLNIKIIHSFAFKY